MERERKGFSWRLGNAGMEPVPAQSMQGQLHHLTPAALEHFGFQAVFWIFSSV